MFKRLLITALIALSVIVPIRPHNIVASGWTEIYQCAGPQLGGGELAKLIIKGGPLSGSPVGLHLSIIDNANGAWLYSQDEALNFYQGGWATGVVSQNGNVQIYLYAWQTSDTTPLYYLIYDPNRTC